MRLFTFLTCNIRSSIPTSVKILELISKTIHTMTKNRWQSPVPMNNSWPAWNHKAPLCSLTHGTHNRNTWHQTRTLKWRQDIIGIHTKFSFQKQNMVCRRKWKVKTFRQYQCTFPVKYPASQGTTKITKSTKSTTKKKLLYMIWTISIAD